ncbi:MAG: SIMPL domain-containing protein [Ruminiclostridium sp.]|nr:SIMPL domain-containing protein [Ruminiclostridium sp.]
MLKAISFKNKMVITAAVLMSLAMLTVAVVSLSAFIPARAADENQPTKRTLNVSGSGTVSTSPDIAYVTLGVLTEDKDAKVAQQDNAKAMDKVISLIRGSGIKSDDIKTINYSIYPKYDYIQATGESRIIGYSVNNSVQVTVRDIAKAGSVIDLAAGSGVNLTSNISFGLSDYDKAYNEALKKALEAAKLKAESMAGVFEIKLGIPVTINENGGSSPIYGNPGFLKADGEGGVATPIQAGTMEIKANVSVVYEY